MYDVATVIAEPELLEPLRRSVERGAPPAYLRSVKIKLTARCNLKCVMCRFGRGESPPELGTERFREILAELAELGCRKVHFSGGEVLARSDFETLVGRAVEVGLKVTFTSNLTLLTKERAKAILRHKPSSISTSLDGATSKTHDAIRGIEGSFDRTVEALQRIARFSKGATRVRVNFVMMRKNFRDYPALVDVAAAHGAADVIPMPVDSQRAELRLSKRLIREYEDEVAPRVIEARARAGMSLAEPRIHPFGVGKVARREAALGRYAGGYYERARCYAPFLHMFVGWDGLVFFCCMTESRMAPLGDLARQSAREVFLGPAFERARAEMLAVRLPDCHRCDMYLDENRALARALGAGAGARPTLPVVA
jgi:MoaA/NifB/PqqE/SkfB family radical SAM enzyme